MAERLTDREIRDWLNDYSLGLTGRVVHGTQIARELIRARRALRASINLCKSAPHGTNAACIGVVRIAAKALAPSRKERKR